MKPPYGVVSAIDLNTGTLKFQVPHGDTPDAVRNHPFLKGLNIPKTGQSGLLVRLDSCDAWGQREEADPQSGLAHHPGQFPFPQLADQYAP